jgi:hypothetical protein
MHCPIGGRADRFGYVRSVFPGDLGFEQGACVRGVTAARLTSAENRVFSARLGGEPAGTGAALDLLIGRAQEAGPGAIAAMVDINRPLEGIAALAGLARAGGDGARVCAFVAPADVPFLAAGIGSCPPFGEIQACDVIVSVGDVCSTHPAVARPLRAMQRANRRNRWISIDTAPGRSTRAANASVLVGPDALAGAVASLAGEGTDDAVASAAAEPFGRAQKPGLLVSCSPGRYAAPSAVLAAAARVAKVRSASLWALPGCTNSLALPSLNRQLGLRPMADVLKAIEAGAVKVLLVLGFDPSSVLPRSVWQGWIGACDTVAWAGSVDCAFAQAADVVLPLALPWEEEGTVLDVQGVRRSWPAWQPPPAGIPSVAGLAGMMADRADMPAPPAPSLEGIQIRTGGPAPGTESAPAGSGEEAVTLVGAPETHAHSGGISLAGERWQLRVAAEGRALCSAAAWPAGLRDGEALIRVGGEAGAPVVGEMAPVDGWSGRVVAMPDHWPLLLELLEWRVAGGAGFHAEPKAVAVEKGE